MNNFSQKVKTKNLKKDEYDVIIIGAGIGGLTCGCYLAKAGLKVLIIEQHHKPGGYCTSFKRKEFTFDATTHYLGSFRENGLLRKIYNELELFTKIDITRFDPSNVVIFPEYKIHIWADINKTIFELQEKFKHEAKNIENFFEFICNSEFANLYIRLIDKTFKDILDIYFKDNQLKSTLGIFICANMGLPPSRASAVASIALYREFVIDGGYYPKGGMQKFSDAFVEKFKEFGGEIILGKKVEKIIVKNQNVKGVTIDKDNYIPSKLVISNGDATSTFLQLIGKEYLPSEFSKKINILETSTSAFIVYLGLNKNYSNILKNPCSWWCSLNSNLNLEKIFLDSNRKNKPYSEDVIFCSFSSSHDTSIAPPDKETIFLFIPAKITNNDFWNKNKILLAEKLIRNTEKFIPDLSNSIIVKEIATPLTLNRYTLNKNGASGWASIISQMDINVMPSTTFIKGLYLVGHWVTQGIGQGGISTVAYCGENVAKSIIRGLKF